MSFEDRSQSYLENGYALGRGYSSSLRLNLQHHLLRELLGYSIHPDILANVDTESHLQIADVGTGTGQWLIDVARELPSAQLDGFDISTDQYPSSAWLPSNILLRQLDIMESIPGNMEGKYDIVHVQLFLCVIQKDPIAVLKELLKMLSKPMSEVLHSSTKWPAALPNHLYLANHVLMAEPGGYLQWVEYDPTTFEVVSPIPSLAQGANEQHVQIIRGPQGLATKFALCFLLFPLLVLMFLDGPLNSRFTSTMSDLRRSNQFHIRFHPPCTHLLCNVIFALRRR